jgi:hypothetical protein
MTDMTATVGDVLEALFAEADIAAWLEKFVVRLECPSTKMLSPRNRL